MRKIKDLYTDRRLGDAYPGLEALGVKHYKENQEPETRIHEVIDGIERIIDISKGARKVCVIGCGPKPLCLMELIDRGYEAFGVEALKGSAEAAQSFVGKSVRIIHSSAENLLLPDESQRIVVMESVLEHVDSVSKCLNEAYRVLEPGGILYVYTTNRYRVSLSGNNGEFNVPFYNWFPRLVREGYVFRHLHYKPDLANYTPRPAVHWFSYADLCEMGREAGFSQFYSKLDLIAACPNAGNLGPLKTGLAFAVRFFPWLRAWALLQYGNAVFMLKKHSV